MTEATPEQIALAKKAGQFQIPSDSNQGIKIKKTEEKKKDPAGIKQQPAVYNNEPSCPFCGEQVKLSVLGSGYHMGSCCSYYTKPFQDKSSLIAFLCSRQGAAVKAPEIVVKRAKRIISGKPF